MDHDRNADHPDRPRRSVAKTGYRHDILMAPPMDHSGIRMMVRQTAFRLSDGERGSHMMLFGPYRARASFGICCVFSGVQERSDVERLDDALRDRAADQMERLNASLHEATSQIVCVIHGCTRISPFADQLPENDPLYRTTVHMGIMHAIGMNPEGSNQMRDRSRLSHMARSFRSSYLETVSMAAHDAQFPGACVGSQMVIDVTDEMDVDGRSVR